MLCIMESRTTTTIAIGTTTKTATTTTAATTTTVETITLTRTCQCGTTIMKIQTTRIAITLSWSTPCIAGYKTG